MFENDHRRATAYEIPSRAMTERQPAAVDHVKKALKLCEFSSSRSQLSPLRPSYLAPQAAVPVTLCQRIPETHLAAPVDIKLDLWLRETRASAANFRRRRLLAAGPTLPQDRHRAYKNTAVLLSQKCRRSACTPQRS